ncbi:MAG: hypothetical protein ACXU6Q_07240 [Croceibacterium sp.]
MNSFAAIAATFALVVPAPPGAFAPAPWAVQEARTVPVTSKIGVAREQADPFRNFRESYRPGAQEQVRIEQHVIIRLVPSPPAARREMFDPPPRDDGPMRYKEKKFHGCVPIDDIAGIAPLRPNRLLLFMRDRHMLSAALERACDADAFYLGAYVERSADGKLCSGRDTLRARTGATCQVSRISRLVALKD